MSSSKLVVFDLDGTLNQAHTFSVRAIQLVQKKLCYPIQSFEKITALYGAAEEEFINTLFPGAPRQIFNAYKDLVPAAEIKYLDDAIAYPGCYEMLCALKDKGYHTAVCSNARLPYIERVLTALGLIDKIDYLRPLSDTLLHKQHSLQKLIEDVKPQAAVMVGDTNYDKKAAEYNRIPFIGCLYGYRPFEMKGLTFVAKTPMNIVSLVEKAIGPA